MKTRFLAHPAALVPILLAVALLALSCGGGATLQPPPPASYKLHGTMSSTVQMDLPRMRPSGPTHGVGAHGWGNNELETYTNRTKNAQIQGGNLVITAVKETYADPSDGVTRNYTSARLKLKAFSASLWPLRSPHQDSRGAGNVARFLDAWQ